MDARNNKVKEMKELVDRYFEGATSAEEEALLRDYFTGDDIDEALVADREFFLAVAEVGQTMPTEAVQSQQLADRLSRQIDAWNMVEKSSSRTTRHFDLRWMGAIAASLLLLVSLGVFVNQRESDDAVAMEESFSDPRDAAVQTRHALVKFSQVLNKGLGKLDHSSSGIKKYQ